MISDVERTTGFYHESTVAAARAQIDKALEFHKFLEFREATKEESVRHALPAAGIWYTWQQRKEAK